MPAPSWLATSSSRRRHPFARSILVVMEIGSRRILHVNSTIHPTAAWTTQQLREVFVPDHPWRYVLHDRDALFSASLAETARSFGLATLKSPPRCPKANAFCERLIGTLRRECLDWIIPLGEGHLRSLVNGLRTTTADGRTRRCAPCRSRRQERRRDTSAPSRLADGQRVTREARPQRPASRVFTHASRVTFTPSAMLYMRVTRFVCVDVSHSPHCLPTSCVSVRKQATNTARRFEERHISCSDISKNRVRGVFAHHRTTDPANHARNTRADFHHSDRVGCVTPCSTPNSRAPA